MVSKGFLQGCGNKGSRESGANQAEAGRTRMGVVVVVTVGFSVVAMTIGFLVGIVAVDFVPVAVAVSLVVLIVIVVTVGEVAVFQHKAGNLDCRRTSVYRREGGKGHKDKGKEEGLVGEHHDLALLVIVWFRFAI